MFLLMTFPAATPCDNSPCRNGATCFLAGANNYYCRCPAGFFARNCEFGKYSDLTPCTLPSWASLFGEAEQCECGWKRYVTCCFCPFQRSTSASAHRVGMVLPVLICPTPTNATAPRDTRVSTVKPGYVCENSSLQVPVHNCLIEHLTTLRW